MAHNVLILASPSLPSDSAGRRRLGLPARPNSDGPGPPRLIRIEAVPRRVAADLGRQARAAGARAFALPDRRPGERVVLLEASTGALDRLLATSRASRAAAAAAEIADALRRHASPPSTLLLARGRFRLERTLVMGILNVTPDSFSDGGRYLDPRAALARALTMAEQGAALIDIGGESTRPGAAPVPLAEELRRVLPVLEALAAAWPGRSAGGPLLSIDTTKAEVARRAAAAGADLINDISGMTFDPAMPAVAAETGLPVVLQHIRGTPRTMQKAPRYRNLMPEIAAALRLQIDRAVRAGVPEDRIVIDPGIGFGKTRDDNLTIIRHLDVFKSIGRPILVGASRKSFIGGPLEQPASERLEGSLAAEALAIAAGAAIIRAHDVREAVRAAAVSDAILRRAGTSHGR